MGDISPGRTRGGTLYGRKLSFDNLSTSGSEEDNSVELNKLKTVKTIDIETRKTMEFSIDKMMSLIPMYNGDPDKLESFLCKCDTYHASLDDAGKKELNTALIFRIEDRACELYRETNPKSYVEFKKVLKKEVYKGMSIPELERELKAQYQGHLSVTEFSRKITNLLSIIKTRIVGSNEEEAVKKYILSQFEDKCARAFKEGLNEPLKSRIYAGTLNFDLKKTIETALVEESYALNVSLNKKHIDGRFATNNSKNNNNYSNIKNNFKPRGISQSFDNKQFNLQYDRWKGNNQKNCLRCRRTGHLENDCYANMDINGVKLEPLTKNFKQTKIIKKKNTSFQKDINSKNLDKDSLVGKAKPKLQLSNQM